MTDDEGGSPYEYSPTRDLHYTHARPSQHHDYSNPQFPPPPAMDPYHPDAHMHSHQYTAYYMPPPPPPPVPPIPPHDPFEEPRSQDYYGGHGGTGRYYQPREREIPRVEKEREKERRWSPPAVAAAEAAHAGALRRNDSSGSSSRGHGKEKERKKIVERGESERKGSRLVEKSSALGTREKGNPLRELEQLRFTPKVTAGTHMRRFEKLVGMAYPGVSSGGKWSMFVKTLDHPGLWGGSGKTTPGRWAMELRKTENMSFDHMKALFIERWGTKEEREQLQSNLDKKKEKDRERQERDHQYLHQQLISTADSLPKTSSKLSHLVIHHDDERPIQLETNAPEGGEIVVTITDDKRRRGKERPTRERLVEGNSKKERQQVQERERERARGSTKSSSRTASTAPKPASKSSSSASPPMSAPPSSPPPQNRDSWGTADPSWGAEDQSWGADEQGKGNFASDAPQQDEWNSGGTAQNEWNQENNSDGGNKDDWNASASPPKSPPREQTPQPKYLAVDEWGANAPSSNPRNTPQPSQESSSTIMAPSSNQGVSLAATAPGSPPAPPLEPTTSVRQRLLEGKIAAITGASRGIGRAIALGFAREGAHIVAHYWGTVSDPSNDDIVSLATEIRGMGQRCEVVFGDISDPDTSHNIVQKAVEEFGRLDIGVGNAGMCWFRDFWDITPELMRRHVDVNLNGNMWFVQACARQMKAQYVTATKTALDEDSWAGDGDLGDIPDHSLLLVSSTTSMTASPAAAHYAASSAGIVSLVQSMAVELGKYGIRCNALLPGTVMTRMVKEGVEDVDRRRGMERRVPLLGRLGRPRDVVGPAIFLAGEQSRYVTGAKLAVDGGASAGGGGGW